MRRYAGWAAFLLMLGAILVWRIVARGQPLAVEIAHVEDGPFVVEWSAVGYVESPSAQVTAPQVGRVVSVHVREGGRVRAGDVLARLANEVEAAGLGAQQAAADSAGAQLAAARATLREAEESQRERERRAVQEVAAARSRRDQAAASLARSRGLLPAQVEAAKAELDSAEARLQDLRRGGRPEEITQAEAEAAAAEATAEWCRSELDRFTALHAQGAAPRSAVESAREALARAEAAVRARRAALALVRQGAREEQVEAARHQKQAAEARYRAARAELTALDVEARRLEEAGAALRSAESGERQARAGRASVEALRNELRAAEARLNQSRESLRQAAALLSERQVLAPFSGVIGRRYVDPGDMASPAQPLFSLVDSDRTWVAAEVDEQDLAPLRVGQTVRVTAPAYAGREFPGRVEVIGEEAVPQTEIRTGARIVRVRVSLAPTPAAQRRLLRPGMEVHVRGSSAVAERTLRVPSDALVPSDGKYHAWVVENGRARRREVRTGYVSGPTTEIVSGLRAGEAVVISGKDSLREGLPVRPRRAEAGSP